MADTKKTAAKKNTTRCCSSKKSADVRSCSSAKTGKTTRAQKKTETVK